MQKEAVTKFWVMGKDSFTDFLYSVSLALSHGAENVNQFYRQVEFMS